MLPTKPLRSIPLLALALASVLPAVALAAEPELVVYVASGRQFRGALDAASTADELVLRSGTSDITFRRPIKWERIIRATRDGQPVEVAELQQEAGDAVRRQESRVGEQQPGVGHQEPGVGSQLPAVGSQTVELETLPPPSLPIRLTSVAFDARIANWDGDVETDGLLIDLYPLDADGYLAAAGGTFEVELFASQRRDFQYAPLSGGDTLERVERWSQTVDPADLTTRGVRLKLPFGAVHPEFDQTWLAHYYGLVHVRFAAPGHGVFEASQDGIRIRPYAPLRDRLELYGGRRFLPTERTGRGVSAANNDW